MDDRYATDLQGETNDEGRRTKSRRLTTDERSIGQEYAEDRDDCSVRGRRLAIACLAQLTFITNGEVVPSGAATNRDIETKGVQRRA